jgi:hypothetical protein
VIRASSGMVDAVTPNEAAIEAASPATPARRHSRVNSCAILSACWS